MSQSSSPAKDSLCRIVLLGDQQVGKSCYVSNLFDQHFDETYTPTVGIDYRAKLLTFSNKSSRIHVFDSSGHQQLKNISKSLYEYAEGFILMYSITDRSSFSSIKEWVDVVNGQRKIGSFTILLANKKDLENSKRQVSEQEGRSFAQAHNMHFYEISTKQNINITESLAKLVGQIHQFQQKSKPVEVKQKKEISFRPLVAFILLLIISLLF